MATLLSDFAQIGPRTSLYTPSKPVAGQLLIISSWLGAVRKHIAKYATEYQKLAQEARILLIESDIQIVTSRYEKQRELIKPAVSVVLDTLAECGYYDALGKKTTTGNPSLKLGSISSSSTTGNTPLRILLHMLSNGGTNSAIQFPIVLRKRFGQPLPIISLLSDSCPSKSHTGGPIMQWLSRCGQKALCYAYQVP